LLEQQTIVCSLPSGRYGPLEWVPSVQMAIEFATASGVVVVEAAGNGAVDLDAAGCARRFDRALRDSGAIIVGAGIPGFLSPALDRRRASFSSYGSRVDVQGWGYAVMTAGYGSYYRRAAEPFNPNYWYTDGFNGTSSASAMVAGAAVALQSIARLYYGEPLSPADLRDLMTAT